MNKLATLLCLLAVGLFMGNAFALNAPAMQGGNPDNWYIEVEYNASGSSNAAHGMVLEWDLDSDSNETLGYTVHRVDTDDAEHTAGIVPAWDDTSHNLDYLGRPVRDGDVFLMQIRGYHSAAVTDGNVVAGQSIEADAGVHGIKDGDGFGFAFKTDATNNSTRLEGGWATAGTFAPVWIDFDKGTN